MLQLLDVQEYADHVVALKKEGLVEESQAASLELARELILSIAAGSCVDPQACCIYAATALQWELLYSCAH
jgi:hypothetical protein